MTKRIAITILLTVWTLMIAGGIVAYLIARAILLADLDDTLMTRALSQPDLEPMPGLPQSTTMASDARDRIVIRTDTGQTIRPTTSAADLPRPQLLSAEFVRLADGSRLRTITLRAYARRKAPTDALVPVRVVYSGPAERFDDLLWQLSLGLGGVALVGGAVAAIVAVAAARRAIKPMLAAASVVGEINENSLDRRINTAALPPELQSVGDKLNLMLGRLEQSFIARRQFLADASHEMRTPIAALVTTLEIALRKPRSVDDYVRTLGTCMADAQMLKTLVAALLEQARAERGTVADKTERIDVCDILRQCVKVAEGLAAAKGVTVRSELPSAVVIETQPERWRGIVMNLLSNAVEYNRDGGTVTLTVTQTDSQLTLQVTDTGVGIDPTHLPHVFEPFYRADQVRTADREASHLGLGLFLVKTHATALGGTIDVSSKLGEGTTFTVRLPLTA